jgi:hypothetical protein
MFESSGILFDIVQSESDRPICSDCSFRPQFDDIFKFVLPGISAIVRLDSPLHFIINVHADLFETSPNSTFFFHQLSPMLTNLTLSSS